jgi:rhodanese-related sulfurtransferase
MPPSPGVPLPSVSAAEAVELIEAGAVLVDVREDYEWADGHAPQARHIPMSRFTQAEADTLPKDRPIVCVCHLGVRSASIANALVAGGWNAVNLTGGMDAWELAGLPISTEA